MRTLAKIIPGSPNNFAECSLTLDEEARIAELALSTLFRLRLSVVALDGGSGCGDSHSNLFGLTARLVDSFVDIEPRVVHYSPIEDISLAKEAVSARVQSFILRSRGTQERGNLRHLLASDSAPDLWVKFGTIGTRAWELQRLPSGGFLLSELQLRELLGERTEWH